MKEQKGQIKVITIVAIIIVLIAVLLGFVIYKNNVNKESKEVNTNDHQTTQNSVKENNVQESKEENKVKKQFKIGRYDIVSEAPDTSIEFFKDNTFIEIPWGSVSFYGNYSINDNIITCTVNNCQGEYMEMQNTHGRIKFEIKDDSTLEVMKGSSLDIQIELVDYTNTYKGKDGTSYGKRTGEYKDYGLGFAEGDKFKLSEEQQDFDEEENLAQDATELSINDKTVKEIREKIDFSKFGVLEEVYKYGAFTLETIPNDLILDIAWNKLEGEIYADFHGQDNEHIKNAGKEDAAFTVSKEEMKKSIESIFGKNIKYTDSTFKNPYPKTFYVAKCTSETVKYEDGKYIAGFIEGGGAEYPFISESVEKAIKHDDKIEIYVKTTFVTGLLEDESGNASREYYADFDFDKNQFINKIDGEDANQAHTYLYTYQQDEDTGEYHLYGFKKLSK